MIAIYLWLATIAITLAAAILLCFYAAIRMAMAWMAGVAIWLIFNLALTFVITILVGSMKKNGKPK